MENRVTLANVLNKAQNNSVYYDTAVYGRDSKFRALLSDVHFELSNGARLTIKQGFSWDENSIPYVLQWAFPKSGMYAVPALVHDALYFDTSTTQEFADKEFKVWMGALKVSKRQIIFRYYAVRIFGGKWWRRNIKSPSDRCARNRQFIVIDTTSITNFLQN